MNQLGIEYHMDVMQHSEEWYTLRNGIITASIMGKLITEKTRKIADNDDVRTIIYDLAGDRINQQYVEEYQSWDMLRGIKEETLAKDLYSKNYAQVKDCGFITNTQLGFKIGASPDGLVGADGGVECKSRDKKGQVRTIINAVTPSQFMAQIQGLIMVSNRKWWDFISYSNGMHMFVNRVEPDAEYQGILKEACIETEKKIQSIVIDYEEKTKKLVKAKWIDVMADESGTIKPSQNPDHLMAG